MGIRGKSRVRAEHFKRLRGRRRHGQRPWTWDRGRWQLRLVRELIAEQRSGKPTPLPWPPERWARFFRDWRAEAKAHGGFPRRTVRPEDSSTARALRGEPVSLRAQDIAIRIRQVARMVRTVAEYAERASITETAREFSLSRDTVWTYKWIGRALGITPAIRKQTGEHAQARDIDFMGEGSEW